MNSKFTSLLLMLLMSAGAAYAGVQQHVEGEPQEKQLYATDFTDWPTIDRKKATDEVVEVKTKYSKETLTFTLNGVGADPLATSRDSLPIRATWFRPNIRANIARKSLRW